MDFGFTLKPENDLARTVALTKRAEANGFTYGWLFDSHVLWREPYVLLTLMAQATEPMRLGTCVTNPATREPSVTASALAVLNELSERAHGPGHRPRRQRAARARQAADHHEDAGGGDQRHPRPGRGARRSRSKGPSSQLPWTGRWRLPVWVAGYGPMAIAMTGRVADGLILQLADPDLIRWFAGQLREAEAAAGRESGSVKIQAAAPGACRPARARPRADALVPGAGQQPRRRPGQQVPARAAAGGADRLRPGPRGLRLPPPRGGRVEQRGLRRRRGDRPLLRPRETRPSTSRSCTSWPRPASTSSTST